MKYNIQAPFNISDEDKLAIEAKLASLAKFNLSISSADVFFKEDDGTNPGDINAQIRLFLPGPDIYAESFHSQAITAFNNTFSAVKKQVVKLNERRNDHRTEIREIL